MSETETRDPEPQAAAHACDAEGHAFSWTQPIEGGGYVGVCMMCRRITTAEHDAAARAEVARLREVVGLLADDLDRLGADSQERAQRDDLSQRVREQYAQAGDLLTDVAGRIRKALAPVVPSGEACVRGDGSVCVSDPDACVEAGVCWPCKPSGEAESGEAVGDRWDGTPLYDCASCGRLTVNEPPRVCAGCEARDPAPVPSGGQADGEGWYEFLKPVVSTTHIAYVHEDASLYLPESGVDEADFHVAQASGRCWRLLREADLAARPVPQADGEGEWVCGTCGRGPVEHGRIDSTCVYRPTWRATRPVLSREALRERIDGHWPHLSEDDPDDERHPSIVCQCGWRYDFVRDGRGRVACWRDHLADVLAGEQR